MKDLHLGMGKSVTDNTGPQVLGWVSVCSEVAEGGNLHFLVCVYERFNDVELHV